MYVLANTIQVFHPFYVFQIASLILWSLDQYYYYAVAIFLMSFGSIVTTLIETRSVSQSHLHSPSCTIETNVRPNKTMRRLREISRFVCDVRVLRNGFCECTILDST